MQQEEEESEPEFAEPYAREQPETRNRVFEDEEGYPICFAIHKSVTDKFAINSLTRDIEDNGGVVRPDDYGVDTVLVHPLYPLKDHLQTSYECCFDNVRSQIWVEPTTFVQHCIREGSVRHRPRPRKGMGGSLKPYRVPFTQEDDENLARYLAHRIPDSEAGGRRGYGVFQDLERAHMADPEMHSWAKRHPWQSWRNRYNKDVERFDRMIDYYVRRDKPTVKQRYPLDRRLVRRRLGRGPQTNYIEEPEQHLASPAAKRRRLGDSQVTVVEDIEKHERPAWKAKGKERASDSDLESEDQLSDDRFRSLFGDFEPDEPGPSVSQRAQVTYADRERPIRRSSPPPFPTQPRTSQATLVASAPLPRGHRAHIPRQHLLHPSPQEPERRIASPVQESIHVEPTPDVVDGPADNELRVPPALSGASRVSHATSRALGTMTHATAASATSPLQRRAVKKARRPEPEPPAPITSPDHAPYRNTRSRSRSVEITALPGRSKARAGKRMVAEEEQLPALTSLEEVPNEDDVETLQSQEIGSASAPAGETLEEEKNVEDFLVNNMSGRSQVTEESARDVDEASDDEMDSDDARTDQMLRRPPPERASQRPISIFNIEPEGYRSILAPVKFEASSVRSAQQRRFDTLKTYRGIKVRPRDCTPTHISATDADQPPRSCTTELGVERRAISDKWDQS
ncbi:hypothetical protein LshimejAT787_0203230 [Lyophyllum shimeji]|uniref:TERF2-interacting telomeric protein 1 Myb domain-containing protein n=1 Tax=Lyophyllum shimeji TaxID=47721 RepID=A0A9P3PG12_LYOSH|nr:hypothetical protein LshimejAT787_0203230 [Lyophyllum shimeji]